MPPLTPPQTVGPFFALLSPARGRVRLRGPDTPGVPIRVEGAVRDGAGAAVADALLEVWQTDAAGRYDHPEDVRARVGGDRPPAGTDGRRDGPEDIRARQGGGRTSAGRRDPSEGARARQGGDQAPADADGRRDRRRGPGRGFTGFGRVHTDAAGGFVIETVKPGRTPGPGRLQAPHLLVGLFARGLLTRLVTRIYFGDEPSNADDPILALVPADRRSTLVAAPRGAGAYRFDIALQGPDETVFFDV